MKLLFVHERFGALAGAEANAHITATELKRRGHTVGIIHGPSTGKGEAAWQETFSKRFSLGERGYALRVKAALESFLPDLIYVHKMAELGVIEALVESKIPMVRMVHDHDIYCMRSYKYNYFTRKICTKAAGLRCIFPCGASIARNHEAGFPFKFISYRAKKREIVLNHKFHRMIVVTNYMKDELLRNGLHIGIVVDEHKIDFARGDFLVRNVLGANPADGSVTVGEFIEIGQTVQFHVRDAISADDDLRIVAGRAIRGRRDATAALMFTCNGRGRHLFGMANHDAEVVQELGNGYVAMGGMFCGGEIGPVGGQTFLHGFTASLALFGEELLADEPR